MGRGVSKTAIQASIPTRLIAQREKKAYDNIESKVDLLMKELYEEKRARRGLEEKFNAFSGQAVSKGTTVTDSVDQLGCSSQARRSSSIHPQESPVDQPPTHCLLKSFKRKVIALGRLNREATTSAESYSIIIDDIYETSAELYASEGTMGDVTPGETITWLKGLVELI